MAEFASLPPDQRAVLQLVLRQQRSYADLAQTLRIPPGAVRDRAMMAAEKLVPPPDEVTDDEMDAIVDHLLRQEGADVAQLSPAGRRWGAELARELDAVAPAGVPDLPEEAPPAPAPAKRARRREQAATPPARTSRRPAAARSAPAAPPARPHRGDEEDDGRSADVDAPPPAAGSAGAADPAAADAPARGSRLGGALLLAGIGVLVAVLLVLLINRSDDSGETTRASTTSATTATTATTPTSTGASGNAAAGDAAGFKVRTQVNLSGPGNALGVAQLVTRGDQAGFAVTAQGIDTRPGTYLGFWVTGGGRAALIAAVQNKNVKGGRFSGLTRVPAKLEGFNRLLVTRERIPRQNKPPTRPSSDVVMRGPLKVPANFRR